jgi:hypothetical protein
MGGKSDWQGDSAHFIDGLLAIAQGLLLIGLSALTMFIVYIPLSIAMITIFGIIGSTCFLYGIEALRANCNETSGDESQTSDEKLKSLIKKRGIINLSKSKSKR